MKKLTLDSKIKDVLELPIARDVILLLVQSMGTNMSAVQNPLVRNLKLSALLRLSNGMATEDMLQTLIDKFNVYANEQLPHDHTTITEKWWKEGICYQIYPRSFYDSDGDGIGDLNGITQKLDYLKELGVTMLWLSPINASPNADNGYDISDYYAIMDTFGTMADFDRLLEQAHARDIRIIMDIVVNHSSDEHSWFQQGLKDKNSPYRDYYYWRKGQGDQPPNNWTSLFSGPAWKYDEDSDEWYLHLFAEKQPDLNWENADMRRDVFKMMNWWADKGVDGFRLDVISFIAKAEGLPEGNKTIGEQMGFVGAEHYAYTAKVHHHLKEMHQSVFASHDLVSIGETPGVGLEGGKLFTHEDRKELDMIFNFDHLESGGHDRFDDYVYDLDFLKAYHIRWQTNTGNSVWPANYFENHDNPRIISKVTKELRFRQSLGKLLAVLQLTLKGTPFIYQGQELGSINSVFRSIDEFNDVESINLYHELKQKGEMSDADILAKLNAGTREHSRTPMAWDDTDTVGFTENTPWLAINPNSKKINVKLSEENPASILAFYKKMIALRKQEKALVYGSFEPHQEKAKHYFAYYRKYQGNAFFIEMNLSQNEIASHRPNQATEIILSNYKNDTTTLKPYEARIYHVE